MNRQVIGEYFETAEAMDIVSARRVCDREGDGRFVHFEPAAESVEMTPETARALSEFADDIMFDIEWEKQFGPIVD